MSKKLHKLLKIVIGKEVLIKAGDYQKAYEEFLKDSSAKGLYNQGNSLTHLGEYVEAIDAYKQAIKKDQILKLQKII